MTVQDVINWLASLPSDDDRVGALYEICCEVCSHCGHYYPGRESRCQCWNDD